jgi:hypothetical protein
MRGICLLVAGLALASAGGMYAVSPYIAIHAFADAARRGELDRLHGIVDVAAVRQGLETQLLSRMRKAMEMDRRMKDPAFAAMAMGVAPEMVHQAAAAMVTPEAFARLLVEGRARPQTGPAVSPRGEVETSEAYTGLDAFEVRVTPPGGRKVGTEETTLQFVRRSAFAWTLFRIQLPLN